MAPDATWWIAGRAEHVRAAGTHTKEGIEQIFRRMAEAMPGGLTVTVTGIVAEGDKVALEMESRGELRNGRVYNNQYHTLVTIRDRKIAEVREYLDTQHVIATWYMP
jgi:ketosteroid isomerase-like protein